MAIHQNFSIVISHPITEEPTDATVSFYYYPGHNGNDDEPPSDPECELYSCVVNGEDILDQIPVWQVHNIEGELLDGIFNDDDFDVPDSYDEEWSYNVA